MTSYSVSRRLTACVFTLTAMCPTFVSAASYLWAPSGGMDSNGYYSWGDEDNWDEPVVGATIPGAADNAVFANIYGTPNGNLRRVSVGSIKLGANRTVTHVEFAYGATAHDYSMEIGDSSAAHTLTLGGLDTNEIIRFDVFNYPGNHSTAIYCPLTWSKSTGVVQFENEKGTLSLHNSILGSNNLSIKGGGKVELRGNNSSYTGQINVQDGSLAVHHSSGLGGSTRVNVSSTKTVTIYENNTFESISGAGNLVLDSAEITTSLNSLNSSVTGSGKVTHTGNGTYSRTIDPAAYTGDFAMNGSGSLVLDFDGAYSGDLTLTNGTLDVNFGDTYTGSLSVGNGHIAISEDSGVTSPVGGYFSDSTTLDLTNFSLELGAAEIVGGLSGSQNLALSETLTLGNNNSETTFSGVISGTGGISKQGNSTLWLNAANTYTGTTTVEGGGRLALTASGSIASSNTIDVQANGAFDVSAASGTFGTNSGQVLKGNGTLIGDLKIGNGAVVAPGASVGALNSNDRVTMQVGSVYEWEISDWNGAAGTGYDEIDTDEFVFEGAWTLKLKELTLANFSETDKVFEIINTSGGNPNSFDPADVTIDTSALTTSFGGTWSVQRDGDKIELVYTAPDTMGPVITLNGASSVNVEALTGSYTESGATALDDEDGDVSADIVINSSAVNSNLLGAYQVTYDVQDSSGNDATTVTRTVNVVDTVEPVISLSNHSSGAANFILECGADTYSDPGFSASDNYDGSLTSSVSVGGDTVNASALGTYIVTYSVADSSGNTDLVNRTVTVADTTGPTITLSGANPLTIECSVGAYSESGVASVSDACDSSLTTADVSINDSNVDVEEVGTYYVYYTLVDSSGNSTTVSREVQVVDTIAPAVSLTGSDPMTVECNIQSYSEPGATMSDAADANPTLNITGSVNAGSKGQYILSYTGTDASGNTTSPAVTRTVNVVDTTAPSINLTGFSQVSIAQHGSYTDSGATANDACDGNLTSSINTDTSAIMPSTLGSYNVVYSVTDAEGNTGYNSRQVLVTGDAIWGGEVDSAWIEAGNWSLGSVIPGSVSTVTFDNFASAFAVDVDGEVYANDLVFNSTSDYTLSNGVVRLASGNISVTSSSGKHTIGSTISSLDMDSVVDVAGSSELVFSGQTELSDLEKRGSGKMTLNGIVTGSMVDITAGTVALTDSTTISGGEFDIASGASFDVSGLSSTFTAEGITFSGNGTISGAVSLGAASTVKPGASAGQLTTGDLEFKSESNYEWEISDWTGTKGTGWDHINSSGAVTFSANGGSKMTIKISPDSLTNFSDVTTSFEILSASSISGFNASFIELDTTAFSTGSGYWVVSQSGNSIILTYTTPGVTVTLSSVSVASDDGETIVVEGDMTTGDTIVVTGPVSPTDPVTVDLTYDDSALMITYSAVNVQEPLPGKLQITFMTGSPSTVNLQVFAMDNPDADGDTTSAISVDYFELGGGFPPEPIHYSGTFVLEILDDDTPMAQWAVAQGLTLGVDAGADDNPDGDAYDNRFEFAFMLDPNSVDQFGSVSRLGKVDVSSSDHFYLTLPVRSSASFNEVGVMIAEVDGVTYTVTGSNDLFTSTSNLVEENPAVTTGLPTLESGYTYKTFRFVGNMDSADKGFIRAKVE